MRRPESNRCKIPFQRTDDDGSLTTHRRRRSCSLRMSASPRLPRRLRLPGWCEHWAIDAVMKRGPPDLPGPVVPTERCVAPRWARTASTRRWPSSPSGRSSFVVPRTRPQAGAGRMTDVAVDLAPRDGLRRSGEPEFNWRTIRLAITQPGLRRGGNDAARGQFPTSVQESVIACSGCRGAVARAGLGEAHRKLTRVKLASPVTQAALSLTASRLVASKGTCEATVVG